MAFQFQLPTSSGGLSITIEPGSSAIFVGANGGGKTRLAVFIEDSQGVNAHRISAHRALALNPEIPKVSEKIALSNLRLGLSSEGAQIGHRRGHRWHQKAATNLLNDFDFLLQAMFAEQANKALVTHQKNRAGNYTPADATNFERLKEIWDRLLPHRTLHFSGDNIEVSIMGSATKYLASEMSDGERAIFYMIGQTLTVGEDSLLIIDEPELHVHRSIMSKLWDELEAARADCGFVFITHDLEFAAARIAQKFVIRDYDPAPRWLIEAVPEHTGFSEEVTTLILGSRRPVLFVEGGETSLDIALYRCCYPDWTVIPKGSCEEVIHSVVTMRKNANLTRVTCAGLVDADHHSKMDLAALQSLKIAVLKVCEIENLILLPEVSKAIAEDDGYTGAELERRLGDLKNAIFTSLDKDKIDLLIVRYCKRRIDRMLKRLDLGDAKNTEDLTTNYNNQIASLQLAAIAAEAKSKIDSALSGQSLPELLAIYENKGLMSLAARHLKGKKSDDFEAWLTRALRNNKSPKLVAVIQDNLPKLTPH
jgi:ABC-type molybdenum transport system ATPase subunit/photorepair protein PhrA